MLLHLESWYGCSARLRITIWSTAMLVLAGMAYLLVLNPVEQQISAQHRQWTAQQGALKKQWTKLLLARGTAIASDERVPVTPFSALTYQRQGRELIRWSPAEHGGELVLDSEWSQLPSIFALLGEQQMTVTAFVLQPAEAALRLTLQLESSHEVH